MLQSTDQICKHKQSIIEDHETQEGICTKCGTVVYNLHLTEDVFYSKNRAGRYNIITNSLTKLGPNDAEGKPCTTEYYDRLRMLNRRTYPKKQQNVQRSLTRGQYAIRRLADKLHLNRIILDRAFQLYSRVAKAQLTRGRSITSITAAVVYLACKDCGSPRSAIEFKNLSEKESDKKRFFKDYQVVLDCIQPNNPPVIDVKSEMARVSSKLSSRVNAQTLRLACQMYDKIKEKKPLAFAGKHPTCLAMSLLYVASMRISPSPIRQSIISNMSGVSVVSLRLRYKNILQELLEVGEITQDQFYHYNNGWKRCA